MTSTPIIDTHVHALPTALLTELCARSIDGVSATKAETGWLLELPGAPHPKPVRAPMADADRRAQWAQHLGLDGRIISPWLDAQPTAAMPPADARDWARRLTSALVADAGADELVLASVALGPHVQSDIAEAVDAGAVGLIVSTDPVGVGDLADPLLEPLWEAAAGAGIPVTLHPPTDGPSRALPSSTEFGNTYCRLIDSTFAVTKLLLAGVLDRHPDLRLVVVHGGGFLPYQSLRLDGGHRADALAAHSIERARPSDYLPNLYFDTVTLRPESIRFLVDVVGSDHVLLGSDYPFPLGDPTPLDTVRAAGLAAADQAAVLGGAAANLFHTTDRLARV
jgi:aminocarboxymuconate-semialdehyde decarboxylase